MPDNELDYADLLDIVRLVEASPDITDFRLKYGATELQLSKTGAVAAPAAPATAVPAPVPAVAAAAAVAAATAPAAEPAAEAAPYPADAVLVRSPMVGTFYRAPEPGAEPFVTVGQHVAADSTVCIIEVMKLMNSIPAGRAGTVTHVLVADSQPVEFNQVLAVIAPDA